MRHVNHSWKRCFAFSLPLLFLLIFLSALPSFGADTAPYQALLKLTYTGAPSVEVHNNKPYFSGSQKKNKTAYESYGKMDALGRCTAATACVGKETMPSETRGEIGMVRPSGWHTVKYNGLVEGNYLYNRCHLIAFCLAGENANEQNLITGTRYMNTKGMLPYENRTANYIDRTGNHVMYRVTPVFEGKNLLCSGVLMEAWSVEDQGKGICFCVWIFNVQPGVLINYSDGSSRLASASSSGSGTVSYALNQKALTLSVGKSFNLSVKNAHKSDVSWFTSNARVAKVNGGTVTAVGAGTCVITAKVPSGKLKCTVTVTGGVPGRASGGSTQGGYVVNTNTGKFHDPSCGSVRQMSSRNKLYTTKTREELIAAGYSPCKNCNP